MRNKHYQPKIKICPLCNREIDCAANPKPFKVYKGIEYHFHCIEAYIREKMRD